MSGNTNNLTHLSTNALVVVLGILDATTHRLIQGGRVKAAGVLWGMRHVASTELLHRTGKALDLAHKA
jgi:hypothetical protein